MKSVRETVFYRLSKHFEFHQKHSATARRIFNSLHGETLSPVFDTLLKNSKLFKHCVGS